MALNKQNSVRSFGSGGAMMPPSGQPAAPAGPPAGPDPMQQMGGAGESQGGPEQQLVAIYDQWSQTQDPNLAAQGMELIGQIMGLDGGGEMPEDGMQDPMSSQPMDPAMQGGADPAMQGGAPMAANGGRVRTFGSPAASQPRPAGPPSFVPPIR